jgi:eukaryotic-like serine/threonine-protein kinase
MTDAWPPGRPVAPSGTAVAFLVAMQGLDYSRLGHSAAADLDATLGMVLAGRYRLVRQLGSGQMARVYVASQLSMGRNVAIKIMHDELELDDEAVGRFRREVTAVSRLRSPHTIQFHDAGVSGSGAQFIAMELLAGETLRQRLERDALIPLDEVVAIVAQIAESLQEAHEAGILHRDLKPENIYLCSHPTPLRPFVKVLDFGLAKLLDRDEDSPSLTGERQVVGTPAYMAPEMIVHGRPVDHRADLYALGCMCFEMVTGSRPYEEPTPIRMVMAHATQAAPRASDRVPHLPAAMDALLASVLAKDPDRRPAEATELAARFAAAAAQNGIPQ